MEEKNGKFFKHLHKNHAEEKGFKAWYHLFLRLFVGVLLVFFAVFFSWYAAFWSSHNFYRVDGESMVPAINAEILPENFGSSQGVSYESVYVDKKTPAELFDVVVINTKQRKDNKDTETIIKRLMALEGDFITISKTTTEDGQERLNFFRIPSGEIPIGNVETFVTDDELWKYDEKGEENVETENPNAKEKGENKYAINQPDTIWTHKKQGNQLTKSLQVTKNGQTFEKEYEANFFDTFLKYYNTSTNYEYYVSPAGLVYVQVPEGMFFYMGDNRAYSSDSRENGFRKNSDIVGPVEILVKNKSFFGRIGEMLTFFFEEVEKFFAR